MLEQAVDEEIRRYTGSSAPAPATPPQPQPYPAPPANNYRAGNTSYAASQKQISLIVRRGAEINWTEPQLEADAKQRYGVHNLTQLNKKQASEYIDLLGQWKQGGQAA